MTEGTLDSLSDAELKAVESLVDALMRRDIEALAAAGAYDFGADPYMYVDDYYRFRGVDLVRPPGPAQRWLGDVIRTPEDPGWAGVCVEIYDRVAGRTDLTLELDLQTAKDGSVRATFIDLHVM
jgi:hypothetical protein